MKQTSSFFLFEISRFGLLFQYSKLKEGAAKLREKLTNKDTESVENVKAAADEFQKQSLKLFETAYKKV